MRMIAILVAALPLFPQKAKPPAPAVAWTFETPQGFQLLEPAYRFPTQIKEALVQCVQPTPALCREYQTVFLDKRKFSIWLKGVLIEERAKRTKAAKSQGRVIPATLRRRPTMAEDLQHGPQPPQEDGRSGGDRTLPGGAEGLGS